MLKQKYFKVLEQPNLVVVEDRGSLTAAVVVVELAFSLLPLLDLNQLKNSYLC